MSGGAVVSVRGNAAPRVAGGGEAPAGDDAGDTRATTVSGAVDELMTVSGATTVSGAGNELLSRDNLLLYICENRRQGLSQCFVFVGFGCRLPVTVCNRVCCFVR